MLSAIIEIGPNLAESLAVIVGMVIVVVQTLRNGREMRPNGGSSLRDAIDRIERELADIRNASDQTPHE
jgi:hypothetical protein